MNNKIYLIALLMFISLFAAACQSHNNIVASVTQPVNTLDNSPIKIGVVAVMSGEAASYGLASKQGMDFAVDEINSKGGINGRQIELMYEDTAHDTKQAVNIMNKFIDVDKIKIILFADGSGPAMAVAPIAEGSRILMMATLASTPELSNAGDYIFRTVPSDAYQGVKLAEFAKMHNAQTAAVLYVNDPYGTGIKKIFEDSFQRKVVDTETFQDSTTDFRTMLTKIKDKNPDIIIIVARMELPSILKQIKELRITSTLIGSETTKNDDYIKAAGSSAEGFYALFFADPQDYADYKTNFNAKYGKDPEGYSYYGYDGVYAIAHAMENTRSTDPTMLKDALYSVKFNGATGVVQFDSNGDVTNLPFDTFKVVNGTFEKVSG